MDDSLMREIEQLGHIRVESDKAVKAYRDNFAKQIVENGLGDEMKSYMRGERHIKMSLWERIRLWFWNKRANRKLRKIVG